MEDSNIYRSEKPISGAPQMGLIGLVVLLGVAIGIYVFKPAPPRVAHQVVTAEMADVFHPRDIGHEKLRSAEPKPKVESSFQNYGDSMTVGAGSPSGSSGNIQYNTEVNATTADFVISNSPVFTTPTLGTATQMVCPAGRTCN